MRLAEQVDELAPDRLARGIALGRLAERRRQSVVESHAAFPPGEGG
jgi:hypothetical protein